LIFDLYKWLLFIAMTTEFDSSIKDRQELEAKILQIKIKIYYIFVVLTFAIVMAYVILTMGYLINSSQRDISLKWNIT
jgi:hypothetical protein